jgi:histidinol-phosphate aminotransferase
MSKSGLRIATTPSGAETGEIPVARRVQDIKPYVAVSSLDAIAARPGETAYKIDWNEATVPPSPKVAEAISKYLTNQQNLNLYPVLNSANLIEKLAGFHGLGEDQFLVTNGSDDGLNTLCTTFLDDDDSVLVASPTYQHFLVFVQSRGAQIAHHYAPDPFKTDLEGLMQSAQQISPRMIYLANPNNPTGVIYNNDELAALLRANPNTVVIVDEAYSEFSGTSAVELLHTYSNLVVTRTFSKAYGMAGLRVGYSMSSPSIISNLRRVFNPKNVNVLAQVGAMAAIQDQSWLQWYLDEVAASKVIIRDWFAERDIECRITEANFFMIKVEQAPWVVRSLQEEGVYVRDRSAMPGLAGYVRYSIGTVEQTHAILERTGRVLDQIAQPS